LPGAVRFNAALAQGQGRALVPVAVGPEDIAVLQYTGGTTGVSKGAVLLHRNVVANVLQSEVWNDPVMQKIPAGEQPTGVCALPLYHIFAFTVSMMVSMRNGGKQILIPNPRDLPAVLKELSKHRFHSFPAVSTLFNGLVNHPDFGTVDWSHLKISVGGGMAVQSAVAKQWLEKTGCPICEGYGLSETSPSASCNPVTNTDFTGTIGVPIPATWMKILDDDGNDVPVGERGEIAIKGPQVMAGYWQRPDETAKVMTADGWFKSGDVGFMDERGYFKIVDRKKDMILVSGFNVYPNEVEDVVSMLPGVLECAAVGVPDEHSGEAVKLFVVKKDPALTEQMLRELGVKPEKRREQIDQVAAAQLGLSTRFTSLQLNGAENGEASGHGPGLSMAWNASGKPIGGENGPVAAYHRLFAKDNTPSDQQKAMLAQRRSVLDAFVENARDLRRNLSKNDAQKLDEYFQGIREIEVRLSKDEQWLGVPQPKTDLPEPPPGLAGREEIKIMYDIMIAAMRTDSTRVMTYRQPVSTLLTSIGVKVAPHDMSHYHSTMGEKLEASQRRDLAQSELLAGFIDSLKATKEADGSCLFDHVALAYGSNIRTEHNLDNCPTLVTGRGAGLKLGHNIIAPKDTPLCNAWLAMLRGVGVKAERHGDSSGELTQMVA
jgi:hypothetical protein